jgi:hypothetical protein
MHIEAAIHAFPADAAGMRDLIAEAAWRLVLKQPAADVTTLATLLKRTRARSEPLIVEIREAGAEGGWLKALTELRNAVTHIAPLANTHEVHLIDFRLQALGSGVLPYLHYPLTSTK